MNIFSVPPISIKSAQPRFQGLRDDDEEIFADRDFEDTVKLVDPLRAKAIEAQYRRDVRDIGYDEAQARRAEAYRSLRRRLAR